MWHVKVGHACVSHVLLVAFSTTRLQAWEDATRKYLYKTSAICREVTWRAPALSLYFTINEKERMKS